MKLAKPIKPILLVGGPNSGKTQKVFSMIQSRMGLDQDIYVYTRGELTSDTIQYRLNQLMIGMGLLSVEDKARLVDTATYEVQVNGAKGTTTIHFRHHRGKLLEAVYPTVVDEDKESVDQETQIPEEPTWVNLVDFRKLDTQTRAIPKGPFRTYWFADLTMSDSLVTEILADEEGGYLDEIVLEINPHNCEVFTYQPVGLTNPLLFQ